MDNRICIGAVIYQMVYDTRPPKYKYYIIVGITADTTVVVSVYINTQINKNRYPSEALKKLHLSILKEENPFLDYDSFVDCSELIQRSTKSVIDSLDADKYTGYMGNVNQELIDNILDLIKSSKTISPYDKKRFGII